MSEFDEAGVNGSQDWQSTHPTDEDVPSTTVDPSLYEAGHTVGGLHTTEWNPTDDHEILPTLPGPYESLPVSDPTPTLSGVENFDASQPGWEQAPADDLNAALAYAQHLVNDPYDHPALQSLDGLNETVNQIAGPEAIAGVLNQPYTPGQTLDDLTWQQLGLPNGYADLQTFITEQSNYIDQLAAQYNPGLAAPIPGYEQFYGPLGLQTGSGVPLPTLGPNSWFGASANLSDILGPYENVLYPKG